MSLVYPDKAGDFVDVDVIPLCFLTSPLLIKTVRLINWKVHQRDTIVKVIKIKDSKGEGLVKFNFKNFGCTLSRMASVLRVRGFSLPLKQAIADLPLEHVFLINYLIIK